MVTTSERRSVASTAAARGCSPRSSDPAPVDVAPLVVGFDGSTPATAALRWAAGTGMPVIVVRVLDPRPRPPGADRPNDSLGVDDAALVLGEHAAVASRRLADCAWRAELVEACSPAAGLAAAARHHRATAIVVGSHRRGGGHTVLGNQLHELLAIADAPIVVVPLAPSIATTTTTARVPPGRGRPSASARSDRV
jgi:nucleotide-binding universal stress UspA family protein